MLNKAGLLAMVIVVGVCVAAHAAESIEITAGFAVGPDESRFAAGLLRLAAQQVPGVVIAYDDATTAQSYGGMDGRFRDHGALTDIVFLYSGRTSLLDEIPGLARAGLIQPVDRLPGYQKHVRPDDIYPNLIDSVEADGHVWAVPVRVCPPCLAVRKDIEATPDSWDRFLAIAGEHQFVRSLDSDMYMLWLTLLAQRGATQFHRGLYDFSEPVFHESFRTIQTLSASCIGETPTPAGIALVTADDIGGASELRAETRLCPFPAADTGDVFHGENVWYVGVSSEVAGTRRRVLAELLGALLSPDVQLEIGKRTYSPPVRPSIAASRAFRAAYPDGSPQAAAAAMTPRLRFRQSGLLAEKTEHIIERAFRSALGSPGSFDETMAEAARQANQVILGHSQEGTQ
ncbi:MAG: hypothetical protein JXR94_11285 [Candidatus Hydrogenedentes bacterium]|nr:hypothetical protein [Candidatus Hydrogenedentota bacterium]